MSSEILNGLLAYVDEIKPYHTKVLDVGETYHGSDTLNVRFTESLAVEVSLENTVIPPTFGCGWGNVWDSYAFRANDCTPITSDVMCYTGALSPYIPTGTVVSVNTTSTIYQDRYIEVDVLPGWNYQRSAIVVRADRGLCWFADTYVVTNVDDVNGVITILFDPGVMFTAECDAEPSSVFTNNYTPPITVYVVKQSGDVANRYTVTAVVDMGGGEWELTVAEPIFNLDVGDGVAFKAVTTGYVPNGAAVSVTGIADTVFIMHQAEYGEFSLSSTRFDPNPILFESALQIQVTKVEPITPGETVRAWRSVSPPTVVNYMYHIRDVQLDPDVSNRIKLYVLEPIIDDTVDIGDNLHALGNYGTTYCPPQYVDSEMAYTRFVEVLTIEVDDSAGGVDPNSPGTSTVIGSPTSLVSGSPCV